MPQLTIGEALEVIANLVEGQRIAGQHFYEVVWVKDHFVCRQMKEVDKTAYLIIKLRPHDINEGLFDSHWDTITGRLRTLIKEGVVK